MNVGGYQIVSFDGINLSKTTSTKIPDGSYAKIEGTKKPILITGIVIDGKEYHDMFIQPVLNGTSYSFTLGDYNIVLSDSDMIMATAVA